MISKHILFAGLTTLIGSTLVLQTVSNLQPTTLLSDPTVLFHTNRSNQLLASATQTHSAIIPQPISATTLTKPVDDFSKPVVVTPPSNNRERPIPRPVKGNQPDAIYSALPFSSGSATAQGGTSTPWWLTTIQNPSAPSTGPSTLVDKYRRNGSYYVRRAGPKLY
jgi:hypothetical protein